MSFKRLNAILISVFMVLLLAIPILPTVQGTGPAEIVRVFAPTAAFEITSGVTVGGFYSMKLDGWVDGLSANGPAGYIQTYGFLMNNYANYWPPYGNRSNYPPDNATILSVSIIAIVRCQIPRPFQIYMIFWNGHNYTYGTSPIYYPGWLDQLFSYNVTATMIAQGAFPAWNATTLKEWSTGNLKVALIGGDPNVKPLYVDYLGLDYIWTNSTTPGGGGSETEFAVMNLDVTGIFGIFGFVGMIAVPAASIWFFRHDGGGSKIYIGIMALVVFTVCFCLFLASINGG